MPTSAPTAACDLVELRQYTLHPGRRDVLIELFDREFVETQEALGMTVMGQFRDLADADRFVWLRGFADMAARRGGLASFYGAPLWQQHRNAANATMIDSDNVLLLRPAWPGAGIAMTGRTRAAPGAAALPAGVLEVTVLPLGRPADEALRTRCRDLTPAFAQAGALVHAWYASETAANDFPALPVREGEPVLVAMALFATDAGSGRSLDLLAPLSPSLVGPPETLRLVPTARSALHA